MDEQRLLGVFGETAAGIYLRAHHYKLLAHRYRCRFGEIDLIAQKGRFVAFVEVKLRKNADFGEAREFVTAEKQRKILRTAEHWLATHETWRQPRFDVIEVYAPDGYHTEHPEIYHLEDAFS